MIELTPTEISEISTKSSKIFYCACFTVMNEMKRGLSIDASVSKLGHIFNSYVVLSNLQSTNIDINSLNISEIFKNINNGTYRQI